VTGVSFPVSDNVRVSVQGFALPKSTNVNHPSLLFLLQQWIVAGMHIKTAEAFCLHFSAAFCRSFPWTGTNQPCAHRLQDQFHSATMSNCAKKAGFPLNAKTRLLASECIWAEENRPRKLHLP
jgi:hypothetical protein